MSRRKLIAWCTVAVVLLCGGAYLVALVAVLSFDSSEAREADAAIVLGAGIDGSEPSAVFRERLNHGIALVRSGTVRRIILTGGVGAGETRSESGVGRDYATANGIAPSAILIEERSTTTIENLREAERVGREAGCGSYVVVSDPLHLRRAVSVARGLGMDATGSGTPTSMVRSTGAKARFALREAFFYLRFVVCGF
ncbi:MAG: YdcF family protein [Planctomycetota bacterium]